VLADFANSTGDTVFDETILCSRIVADERDSVRSPNQLECKLNLAGWRLCGGNEAGVTDGISHRIEHVSVVEGRRKIGVVYDVKELCAKLDVEGVGDSLDEIVFEQRKIEIHQARADQRVASQVAAQVETSQISGRELLPSTVRTDRWRRVAVGSEKGLTGGRWNGEALRFDVVIRVPGVHKRPTAHAAKQIRHIHARVCARDAERVSREARREGNARTHLKNSSNLPSS